MEDTWQAVGKRRSPPWLTWAVVALCFGVVASVALIFALPLLKAGRRSAREAIAIRTIQAITLEQRAFYKERGSYGSFDELVESGRLNKLFSGEAPAVEGYVFRMKITPHVGIAPAVFSVTADPLAEDSGRHFYLTSSNGEVRYSVGRPAGPSDPVLSAR